jgi:hypothetical protein
LLKEGVERSIERSYFLLEYKRPVHLLGSSANFMVNAYHQRQRSNLKLFRSKDTSVALGFGWLF